jgi:hypothetical protein
MASSTNQTLVKFWQLEKHLEQITFLSRKDKILEADENKVYTFECHLL